MTSDVRYEMDCQNVQNHISAYFCEITKTTLAKSKIFCYTYLHMHIAIERLFLVIMSPLIRIIWQSEVNKRNLKGKRNFRVKGKKLQNCKSQYNRTISPEIINDIRSNPSSAAIRRHLKGHGLK